MIAIVNTKIDEKNPMAWAEYEVRINRDVIATFRHERRNGLAQCLIAAAKAVEQAKWRDVERLLNLTLTDTKK